jgi:NTE family protein
VSRNLQRRKAPSLARFFQEQLAAGDAVSFCLPGGTPLFTPGEMAEQLYFLKTGRLGVSFARASSYGVTVMAGETIGEMAVLAGLDHASEAVALRDCELIAAPRKLVFDCVRADPDLLQELSRLTLVRARETQADEPPISRRVLGVIALTPAVDACAFADRLNTALIALGHTAAALASDSGPTTPEWFARLETSHEFVLYSVEHGETAWGASIARQVDGLIAVAVGDDPGAALPAPIAARALPTDLVLLQAAGAPAPRGSQAWAEAVPNERLFQVRRGVKADVERLARGLTGRGVGLVLSGGAARAYAHVGAVKVLHERGIPLDTLGGVSMGAIIAAGLGMGWDDQELDERLRHAFVDSSPLGDITWPLVAITKGELVRDRLAEHFGDRTIADLWLPFFCVSANLTIGEQQIHRQGLVREALCASLSLPGVLPPATLGEDVLVDGAVLNNFPADVMRLVHKGPIIGVDVGAGRSLGAADIPHPGSVMHWLTSGAWREGAPIVSILIRAATLSAYHQTDAAHQAVDVLIEPKLDDIEVGDWKAYDPAVARGAESAREALANLPCRLEDLRHAAE